jgi:hypothetical protein
MRFADAKDCRVRAADSGQALEYRTVRLGQGVAVGNELKGPPEHVLSQVIAFALGDVADHGEHRAVRL